MAIKERDVVLVSTNENNDTIIDMPVTRENCVEGLGRIRGTAYSVGDVALCAGSMSLQLICTVAGTTSTDELDITGKVAGDSVVDGTVTWIVAKRNYFNNSGVLPISEGGTGANNVAGARNNLGLGNTNGALPIANGGTGATAAAAACANIGAYPKTGGELLGNIHFNNAKDSHIYKDINDGRLILRGSVSAFGNGASLYLYGKDNTDLAGGFEIYAHDGTNGKYLRGKPDGTLIWDNHPILRMIDRKTSGSYATGDYCSCFKFNNGLLIAIGFIGGGTTITFPIPFIDVPPCATTVWNTTSNNTPQWRLLAVSANTTSITNPETSATKGFIAIGKWKEIEV